MTSQFYNDGATFNRRGGPRGHASQLSISDPSHHVTEAISTLYGSEDEDATATASSSDRPLSFMPSTNEELHRGSPLGIITNNDYRRSPNNRSATTSDQLEPTSLLANRKQNMPSRLSTHSLAPSSPLKSPTSPSISLREYCEKEQFEEPNDIAQELSNLQALRRLSMDVGNSADPDMLPYSGLVTMSPVAPSGDDDVADPSRLLWVPARVHPELAPTEFKSFIEDRVRTIKRRSGDSSLGVDTMGFDRSGSLRRKKSMLSRQVDSSASSINSQEDGEDLTRQRSYSGSIPLDELVHDAPSALKKLSLEADSDGDPSDKPVLAKGPGRMGLQRSTRTQYRKGGSIRGDRSAVAKRIAARHQDSSGSAIIGALEDAPPLPSLQRSNTEPGPVTDNFSRPKIRRTKAAAEDDPNAIPEDKVLDTRPMRSTSLESQQIQQSQPLVPQIVATPAENGQQHQQGPFTQRSTSQKTMEQHVREQQQQPLQLRNQQLAPCGIISPQRSPGSPGSLESPGTPDSPDSSRADKWVSIGGKMQDPAQMQPLQRAQSLQKSSATSTGSDTPPSVIIQDARRPKTKKKDKDRDGDREKEDDTASISSTRSAGWKWFKSGSDDKEKKKKEDSESRKHKAKHSTSEKAAVQENVRLDVLQNQIDAGHARSSSRESAVLDRDLPENRSLAVDEATKEKDRKHARGKSDAKKDGLFSSIFGGSKKKADRESTGSKKGQHLKVTEETMYKPLRPDIDYPWTRYALSEERTIYRMAHVKLSNPRRSLHSQVLLSNFMYNYLAIVQAMNPQMQVPLSPAQRRQEEERRKREAEAAQVAYEQQLREQQMLAEQGGGAATGLGVGIPAGGDGGGEVNGYYDYDQAKEYAGTNKTVDYVDEASIFEYDNSGVGQGQEGGYYEQNGYYAYTGQR